MVLSADEVNGSAVDCHISYAAYGKSKLHCKVWTDITILK
jgi:hypothetical protein